MSGRKSIERVASSCRFIREAIVEEVLRPVSVPALPGPHLVLACGDFTQLPDRLIHYWERVSPESQLIGMHGGALLLDPASPENQAHHQLDAVVYQIRKGIAAKARHGVRFSGFDGFVDWHCGVADEHGMSVQRVFSSALRAEDYFSAEVAPDLPYSQLFYCGTQCLHGLSVALEHPQAKGLTFTFNTEEMALFLETYRDPVVEQ